MIKIDSFMVSTLVIAIIAAAGYGCSKNRHSAKEVVIYVSEDQVFSQPVLKAFTRATGIKVKAVYDTEEAKSTGVMNRLISERSNPQADVYWANEPIRAEVLKQKKISAIYFSPAAKGISQKFKDKDGYWTGFSARARVLIVNSASKNSPDSIYAYTDKLFTGRSVMANPLFGTTTSQVAALFTILGDNKAKAFMDSVKNNGVKITTSNGESADFVASGKYDFSLVDSDDAISRIRQGLPVKMIYPDQKKDGLGTLVLPNTVMLIKGAPHKKEAKKLIDFLLSKKSEQMLAFADCAQIPLNDGVKTPKEIKTIKNIKTMPIDYKKVAAKMVEIQPYLKAWTGL